MFRRLTISLMLSIAFWLQTDGGHQRAIALAAQRAGQQPTASAQTTPPEQVRAVTAPRNPLPSEAASADAARFSFIVYGDTRGRRDGVQEQYEHSLIVDSALATIKRLEKGPFPVRFVLQTGDAVVNGRDARQWNKACGSYQSITPTAVPCFSRQAITM
jgi:hypothetical protein